MDLDYAGEMENYSGWVVEIDRLLVGGIYLQLVEISATTAVCQFLPLAKDSPASALKYLSLKFL